MTDLTVNALGRAQAQANTTKDGSGTEYRLLCDSNGRLEVVLRDNAGNLLFDTVARAGFVKVTDGTNIVNIVANLPTTFANTVELLAAAGVVYGYDLPNTRAQIIHAMGGEALSVARGHANGSFLNEEAVNTANGAIGTLRSAAVIDANQDAYIYSVKLQIQDAADYMNAAGEALAFYFTVGATGQWGQTVSFDKGHRTTTAGGVFYVIETWNLATPFRVAANTNILIGAINSTGNTLDSISVIAQYYLE